MVKVGLAPNEGYLQVRVDSSWIYVSENNWNENRHKMLCRHLGFTDTGENDIKFGQTRGNEVAIGDLICYNTGSNGSSCCTHLIVSKISSTVSIPYVKCEYK